MWEIKFSSKSKFKGIKDNNKIKMQMQIKNKRTILKCRAILKGICIQKKNKLKEMILNKDKRRKLMRKWEM